ncbi:hypothetical protein [Sphaerisporangium rhizosphaerae]|uniref:Uncharacterized protein n=1 Tax=Sphaerisporangium rhizosphaerae TaxID=2269375 RepID=A0ABW2NTK6_9ACTN
MPFGPADPQSPLNPVKKYGSLYRHDCASLLGDEESRPSFFSLFESAAEVCTALTGNAAEHWEAARRKYQDHLGAEPSDSAPPCLVQAVRRFISAALAAHDAEPSTAPPVVRGSGQACPFGVTSIEADSDAEDPEAHTLLIHGTGLWVKDSRVTVNGEPLSAGYLSGPDGRAWDGYLTVDLRAAAQASQLKVCVVNDNAQSCKTFPNPTPAGPSPEASDSPSTDDTGADPSPSAEATSEASPMDDAGSDPPPSDETTDQTASDPPASDETASDTVAGP